MPKKCRRCKSELAPIHIMEQNGFELYDAHQAKTVGCPKCSLPCRTDRPWTKSEFEIENWKVFRPEVFDYVFKLRAQDKPMWLELLRIHRASITVLAKLHECYSTDVIGLHFNRFSGPKGQPITQENH